MSKPMILALAFATTALPCAAQTDDVNRTGATGPAEIRVTGRVQGRADLKFFNDAAMGGLVEVRLGEVAQKQAASEDVRSLAQRLMDQHETVNDELKVLADAKVVTFPAALDKDHQELVDKVLPYTGPDFDREYLQLMTRHHEEQIELYEREAKRGDDPDLRAFAQRVLPDLHEHLRLIKQTRENVGQK